LYSENKRSKKAELYFRMAFSLGSPSSKLHYNYALHCERMGRDGEALKHYEACLKSDPSNKMALNNLGVLAFKHGDYKQAAELFKRSLRFDPRNSGKMVNLAAAFFLAGNRLEAENWLKKALTIDPESRSAIELLRSMRNPRKSGK
jgi:tetratricopeptide (TPR) repeat protein